MAKIVRYSLRNVKARDVSNFNKSLQADPQDSLELFAALLAKTVVEAPPEVTDLGPLDDPETYLELPFWGEGEEDEVIFMSLVEGLNEALEKAQNNTKKP